LAVLSVVDVGAISAAWNVRHAREVGGSGVQLDVCFLQEQGQSALVPMAELLRGPLPEPLRARVAGVFRQDLAAARRDALDWRSWTWRRTRRLERVEALTRDAAWRPDGPVTPCWGAPPPAPPQPKAPLTYERQP